MIPTLLLSFACGWNHLPDQSSAWIDEPLWAPDEVIVTADGLYVPLPHAGGLALVAPGEEPLLVDIGEGRLVSADVSPDGERIVAVIERYRCDADDDVLKDVVAADDCPAEDRITEVELDVIDDGAVQGAVAVDSVYNAMSWSADGRFAVAWLDLDDAEDVDGVVSLTTVLVLDLDTLVADNVQVGFAASRVLFTADNTRAVVLSQSEVAVLDLTTSPPTTDVTFALTLDPDDVVDPVGVSLTPDGRYALISVRGAGDLYVLDLESHSVNLVTLSDDPADMHVDVEADRTVLVYDGEAVVDLLEHEYFDIESVELDEPMTDILDAPGFVLLWSRGRQDVYELTLENGDVTEYRLQSAAESVHLAPSASFAIAFTWSSGFGGKPGMEVLDLREDRGVTYPYALDGDGVGVAFAGEPGAEHALVLQDGVDYVYALDLQSAASTAFELAEPPLGIGAYDDTRFYITHDSPLGLVSFLDPATGEVVEVAGFGALGIADPIGVVTDEEAP